MPKRDWTDAEYEIVSEAKPTPQRWDPLRGLGPVQQLLAVGMTVGGLAILKWLIAPPIARFADWLLALCGVGGSGA